jgi:cytochrome P450
MTVVTQMALPRVPAEDPAFGRDPQPFIEAARGEHPWLARCASGYLVFGYHALRDLHIMDDKLRPSFGDVAVFYGAEQTGWGRFMRELLLAISGEKHTRIRGNVNHAFTPKTVKTVRPVMRERISELLDEWAPKGGFDFVEFASWFPISVLCAVLGTTGEEVPRIRHALETQVSVLSMNPDLLPDLLAAYEDLYDFCDRLIVQREAAGPPDRPGLLDALIQTQRAGKIDETELRFLVMVLYLAGFDTTRASLTLTMHLLLQNPGHWDRCAQDIDYCAKVVDEAFRHTSMPTVFRTVAEPFAYDGIELPQGTRLFLANSLVGRDPDAFPDPLRFDPEREPANRHVAFGRGVHNCVGQYLARAQLIEGLHLIAQRLAEPRLAGEVGWRPFFAWGLATLPITFEPREPEPGAAQARERSPA